MLQFEVDPVASGDDNETGGGKMSVKTEDFLNFLSSHDHETHRIRITEVPITRRPVGTSYIVPVKRERGKILSFVKTTRCKMPLIFGTLVPSNPREDGR